MSSSYDVFMGERMSTKDAPIQCYNAIWGQFWGHGPLENLLEIGLSIITRIPCIRFDCNCTLHQTTEVNTDVAGKKAGSYMTGHRGVLLEVQSHAEL